MYEGQTASEIISLFYEYSLLIAFYMDYKLHLKSWVFYPNLLYRAISRQNDFMWIL